MADFIGQGMAEGKLAKATLEELPAQVRVDS
jgi:hypothetical protein